MSQQPHHHFDLLLEFDADQVSPSLTWKTKPNAVSAIGAGAGALHLARDGRVGLNITATGTQLVSLGHLYPYTGFSVRQCALYAQPKLLQCSAMADDAVYAAPAPFTGAAVAVRELSPGFTSSQQFKDDILTVSQQWDGQLVGIASPGRWVLTLVVTVDIARKGQSMPTARVFQFDTELFIDPAALL